MSGFFEALEELKKNHSHLERAVNIIIIDRQSPANPFGISRTLEESLDQELEDGNAVEASVRNHSMVKKPGLHTEAAGVGEHIKRVVSKQTFMRWHLGKGDRTGNFTSVSDMAWADLEDIIEPGKDEGQGNMIASHSFEPPRLKGTTGRKGAAVWWTWDEHGQSFTGTGRQYIMELALSENERRQSEMDEMVVEVTILQENHPEKLYRPTGLDSFFPDTLFYPNLNPHECFGRTRPIPPANKDNGRPEVVGTAVEYAEQLEKDTRVDITFIKY